MAESRASDALARVLCGESGAFLGAVEVPTAEANGMPSREEILGRHRTFVINEIYGARCLNTADVRSLRQRLSIRIVHQAQFPLFRCRWPLWLFGLAGAASRLLL